VKVFVTGATGALGPHAVRALTVAGHVVSALVRSDANVAVVSKLGATPIRVSLFDEAALTRAFEDVDAVVNLASALPPTAKFMSNRAWKQCHYVRTVGSATIVAAAATAGVPCVIQESVSMLYPDRGVDWIDESTPPTYFPAAKGNLAAEASAARFADTGGRGVVLRLGWFYGPGAQHSEELFSLAKRHIVPIVGRREGYVSSIHVEDAGRAVVAALAAPSGAYNVVDNEPLTKAAYADALATAAATRPWIRGPGRAALLLRNSPGIGLARSLRVSNAKLRETTGWSPIYSNAHAGWQAIATTRMR
jgi:nucleoside-diphosphate-sugar epimerase